MNVDNLYRVLLTFVNSKLGPQKRYGYNYTLIEHHLFTEDSRIQFPTYIHGVLFFSISANKQLIASPFYWGLTQKGSMYCFELESHAYKLNRARYHSQIFLKTHSEPGMCWCKLNCWIISPATQAAKRLLLQLDRKVLFIYLRMHFRYNLLHCEAIIL